MPNPWTTQRHVYATGVRLGEVFFPNVESKLLSTSVLRISGRRKSRRRMYRRLTWGYIRGYAPICYDNYDPATVLEAFSGRLLRDLPCIQKRQLQRFALFVRQWLEEHRDELSKIKLMTFEEWLSSEEYPEWRKAQLRTCYLDLHGGLPSKKRSSHVDSFVKSEFYQKFKRPRMINSRVDDFKVISGRYFKSIERVLYDMDMPISFIKHVPVPERPALISKLAEYHDWKCRATDYTAFESSISSSIMQVCECALYKFCFPNDPIMEHICNTISGMNVMRTRTGIKVQVRGRRMSGDMCTSLGNGFTNLMLASFIAGKGNIVGYVEGDDGLFMTQRELDCKDYESLGFKIKIEKWDEPGQASFCGLVFSSSGQIIRDPFKFFQGFGWTLSCINAGDRVLKQLLRAKALSSCYETPHCPIVGVMARMALKKTAGVTPRWVEDGYHKVPRDALAIPDFMPTLETRRLFFHRYGISVEVQLEVEDAIRSDNMELVASLLPAGIQGVDINGETNGSSPDVTHYASHFLEVT